LGISLIHVRLLQWTCDRGQAHAGPAVS
jgi:hypothetical protein